MNIFNDFISAIESILDFVVELLDDVVTLITSIPSILAEAIEAAGGCFSIFTAFFDNIPRQLWIAMLLSGLGIFLMSFLHGKGEW